SLHENTAERSPPLSAPEGIAITSASNPASSSVRCALSFPAHNSMQPNGRAADVLHTNASRSIFLNFIPFLMRNLRDSLRTVANHRPCKNSLQVYLVS